jgi:hypothetical protein
LLVRVELTLLAQAFEHSQLVAESSRLFESKVSGGIGHSLPHFIEQALAIAVEEDTQPCGRDHHVSGFNRSWPVGTSTDSLSRRIASTVAPVSPRRFS